MNRELVRFYNENNYDLASQNANQNILQTIIDSYPVLKESVHEVKSIHRAKTAWVRILSMFTSH